MQRDAWRGGLHAAALVEFPPKGLPICSHWYEVIAWAFCYAGARILCV
jgi:hypothetical protein